MSIHFGYTVDVNQAIDNLDKVEKKVVENIDTINKVSQNINYSDNVTKPFKEAQGIISQLKDAMQNTGKISQQELNVLQDNLITASDKLRDVEYLNKTIINDLEQGLAKAKVGRFNANNGDDARKYTSQVSEYQKYISIHKQLSSEAKKLGNELDMLQGDINKVSSSLDKQEQSTNKTKNSSVSFLTQLRKLKQELYEMKLGGDTTSEAYKKLSAEIMKLEATRKGATNSLNPLSNYKGIISGMSAISGATTAAAGAISLFGEKSQAVQAITSKLNALMSITIGLQQIEQQLLSSSAFKVNIVAKAKQWWANVQNAVNIAQQRNIATTTAQTTAQIVQTSATKKGILANTLFAKSFRTIGLAIKSIPGIGWLLAIVGVIIGVVSKINSSIKKAKEEQQRAYEEMRKDAKDFSDSVAKFATPVLMKYGDLQDEYKKLKTLANKNQWIKQHQKDFNDLGIAINGVSDADKVFIQNTGNVIQAIMARSKAIATQNLITKLNEEKLSLEVDLETSGGEFREEDGYEISVNYEQIVKAEEKLETLEKKLKEYQKESSDILKNAWLTPSNKNINNDKKELEQLKRRREEYKKLLTTFRQNGRDALISLIADDSERELQKEKERFRREKEKLDKEVAEIKERAKDAKENVPDNIDEVYNKRKEALEKEHYEKLDKIQKEAQEKYEQELFGLLDSYADYNEKRLAIDRKYNEDLEKLQELRKQAEKGNENDVKRIDNAVRTLNVNKTKEVIELDFQQLKETPEYVRAFEDLENTSTETIRYLIQEFDKVKQAAAENLDPKDLQEYIDVLEKMQTELDRRDTFTAITNARLELKIATEELIQAEKEHAEVEKNFGKGSVEEIAANKKVATAKDKQAKATKKLIKAETTLLNSIKDLASGFKDLGDSIGGDLGKVISTIGDVGVTIISTIIQLKALQQQALLTAGAMKVLQTANVVLAAISAGFTVLKTLYTAFFDKEDNSYERATIALEGYVEVLDKVIAKEKELIDVYAGQAGQQAYEKAKEYIEKQRELEGQALRAYLRSGASWRSSSQGVKMQHLFQKKLNYYNGYSVYKDLAQRINEQLGTDYRASYYASIFTSNLSKIGELSVTELEAIKSTGEIWSLLDDETRKYINTLIDLGDELSTLREDYEAKILGLSANEWFSEWIDGFMDLDATAEDVFNNITDDIRRAMLKNALNDAFGEKIKALYEKYRKAMFDEDGNIDGIDGDELANLKDGTKQLTDDIKEYIKGVNDLFPELNDAVRSASNNAFASMTQDQSTKLEGMFTAVQGHTYDIRDYTHEMRDCAVIIQREISGIHVDTSTIVRLLGGVENRMAVVDSRLKGFEMRGVKMN